MVLAFVFHYHGFLILVVIVVVVLAAAGAALGSRLPVVCVCLGEDHLGCFQPALLGLWLVHALFDLHQGSRDAFTHGSSCIALFGHVMISSGARALHWSKEGGGPPLPPHGETLSCKLTFTLSCKLRMCAII